MARFQQGYIHEAFGAFHVRYYQTENDNGKLVRKQKSHRLVAKDDKHYSRTCKAVKLLCEDFMRTVNTQEPSQPRQDVSVAQFWEKTYLPFAKENLRVSTVHGYEKIWEQHLKLHFGEMTLKEYRTPIGSQFLTALAKKLGRRTLQHVRSLASGIFTHAVNVGSIESNPWHDVKILGRIKAPNGTAHYTLEEAENIISALVEHVNCQLIMALAFFLGLRPGEIAGLRWEDFDTEWVHIRRSVWRGIAGPTKTPESVASLPLIEPVHIPLMLWREKCGNPSEGWVFESNRGKPADLHSIVNRIIIPAVRGKGLEWKGIYAGRRGAGTILTQLTGDALAAQQILRHKNLAVTTGYYVKQIPEAGLNGMRLLEAAAQQSVTANGKNGGK